MPLQIAGPISFSNIMSEYGISFQDSNPKLFSDFYQRIGVSSRTFVTFSNFFGRSVNDVIYGAGIFYFSNIGLSNVTLRWTHSNITSVFLSWNGGSSNITSPSNIVTLCNFAASNYTFTATPCNNNNQALISSAIGASIGGGGSSGGASVAVATDLSSTIEGGGWMLLYEVTNPVRTNNLISYNINNSNPLFTGTYPRIAFYMQLRMDTATTTSNYVFATMDPFPGAANLNYMFVPDASRAFALKSNVTNMNVYANYNTVDNVTSNTGRFEFWPDNYATGTTFGDGNGSTYDFDDSGFGTNMGYGSFQIHNITQRKTIIAWNQNGGGTPDVGLGNQPSGNPDWTFANNYTTNPARYWFLRAYVKSTGPVITSVNSITPSLNSITLQWSGNSYSNVVITLPNGSNISPISSNINTYTATGLLGNTNYLYRLTPYSTAGVAGNTYFFTANTASSALSTVTTSNVNTKSLLVLWSSLLSYSNVVVSYGSTNVGPVRQSSLILNNLIPSSTYNFVVTPYDNIGLPGMAASNTVTLPGSLKTQTLTASSTSSTITIQWPTLSASSFIVTWPPSNTSGSLSSNATSYIATGLAASTSYTFTVTPYNINGVAGEANTITASTLSVIASAASGTTTNGNFYGLSVTTAGTGFFDTASNNVTADMINSMSNLKYFYVTNSTNNLNKSLFMWTSNVLTSGTYRIYFQPSAKTLTGNTTFTVYTSAKCFMTDGSGKYWFHDTSTDQARLTTTLTQADMLTTVWTLSGSILPTYPGYHLFRSAKDANKYIRHAGQVMWFNTSPANFDYPYQPTVQTNHTVRFINPWNTSYYLGTWSSDANRLFYGNTGTQYWNMIFPDSNAAEYVPGIQNIQTSAITTTSFTLSWATSPFTTIVSWNPGNGSSSTLPTSQSNYTISNLNSNNTYTATITPYNGSNALSASTATVKLPILPEFGSIINYSNVSATSVLLQWDLTKTTYDYVQITWSSNTSVNLTTQSNYQLSNLISNTLYNITATPFTTLGITGCNFETSIFT